MSDIRVLYIAKFKEPTATHGAHEQHVVWALREHGAVVHPLQAIASASLQRVVELIQSHNINVVLFSKAQPKAIDSILTWCRAHNVLTVTWCWDLYWGYRPRKPRQFSADMLFTTDGGHLEHWQESGYNHQTLRQGIHEGFCFMLPEEPRYDVGFVGTLYPQESIHPRRRELLKHLSQNYNFCHLTKSRGEKLNEDLAKIKIVVGDSYPAPNYWSNRIYELLGRGCFLLYPRTVGLEAEFKDGLHCVGFERGNYADLDEQIRRHLAYDCVRQEIKQEGFLHVKRNYTYTHRVRVLLQKIREALNGEKEAENTDGQSGRESVTA